MNLYTQNLISNLLQYKGYAYEKYFWIKSMTYKHDYDKILTRLTIILGRLNDGEALSVRDLAKEFNVSIRTIQRDFNERLVAQFPIYQVGKKWKMQEKFKGGVTESLGLEKSLSIEEHIVLNIIDKLTEGVGDNFYAQVKKLLTKIKNSDFNPIYTKLYIEDISDKVEEIQRLEVAIRDKKVVRFIYDFERYKTSYKVKPLKIVNFEGFWYLMALDAKNDILKTYYAKNISTVEMINEGFSVSLEVNEILENAVSIWFQAEDEPFEVKLFIGRGIAKYFKRKPISKTQRIITHYDDGSIDISLYISHEMEILPIIKYWLPHIKILEPLWIDGILREDMAKYYEVNEE